MKKLVAFLLSAMMVVSIAAVGMMSAGAVDTGSLTITKKIKDETKQLSDMTGLNGVTYTLYQVFAKTDNGYQITNPEYQTALESYTSTLTKAASDENTYVTYGSTDALQNQIGALLAATDSNTKSIVDSATMLTGTTEGTVSGTDPAEDLGKATITGIPYGVYLVVETGVPASYTFTDESQPFLVNIYEETAVQAIPKNQKHPLTKDIVDTPDNVNSKSFEIGDTVRYVVNTTVPNYNKDMIQGLKDQEAANETDYKAVAGQEGATSGWDTPFSSIPFTFTDTLSNGLTLNFPSEGVLADAFTIKVGPGTGEDQKTLVQDTDYTVSENPTRKYTINIKFASLYTDKTHNYLNAPVEITYSATLNKDAIVSDGTTGGNGNDIKLSFKNNPSIDTTPVEFDNTDEDPKVYTYTMEFEKLLNGQKFTERTDTITPPTFKLFHDAAGTQPVKVSQVAAGTKGAYVLDATGSETLELDNSGKLSVKGLKAGNYYLTEPTAARAGSTHYTPLGAPIQITVEDVKNGGELTGVVHAYLAGAEGTNLMKRTDGATPKDTGVFAFTVNNPKSQFDIPNTGGYGILIFTLSAAVVLAGAVIVFILARRKKNGK